MQFALPPKKAANPPPYVPASRSAALRRRQLKSVAVIGVVIVTVLFLLTQLFSSSETTVAPVTGGPKAVIVTVLDEQFLSDKYIQRIKQNREDYAKRHGYVNFFASTSEYLPVLGDSPRSWSIVPAVRHALSLYPSAQFFFHISAHALIMNPSLSLTKHILDKDRLEKLMIKDAPVVPPDSVIKTFGHLAAKDVDFVISQDAEDLAPSSFVLRRTEWANYLLDAWFDPLYRSYNFAKAETHALDHIVQWHPTLLAKLALVPQRILNSYSKESPSASTNGVYKDEDFVVNFAGCDSNAKRNCEKEMEPYWMKWARETHNLNE